MEAKSFYQELMDKGYSRRDFLKFCGMMGARTTKFRSSTSRRCPAKQTEKTRFVVSLPRMYLL